MIYIRGDDDSELCPSPTSVAECAPNNTVYLLKTAVECSCRVRDAETSHKEAHGRPRARAHDAKAAEVNRVKHRDCDTCNRRDCSARRFQTCKLYTNARVYNVQARPRVQSNNAPGPVYKATTRRAIPISNAARHTSDSSFLEHDFSSDF